MPRFCLYSFAVATVLSTVSRADDFDVALTVKAGDITKTAKTEVAEIGAKPKTRTVLKVKLGQPLYVKWSMENVAKKSFPNVVVHFVAVKQKQLNQCLMPKLTKGVAAESALTMDFKQKSKTAGELSFAVSQPGLYLVRIETIGAAAGGQREYYAALDLVVK